MAERTRMCAVCQKLLDAERADAIKRTDLCAEHGEEIKKYGGEFLVIAVQENLSKPGSMKPNPGGVLTKMVPNRAAIDQLRDEYRSRLERDGKQSIN